MKRGVVIGVLAVLLVSLGVAVLMSERRVRDTQVLYTSTKAAEDSIRARYESAVDAFAEIQDSLAAILPSESDVMHLSRDLEGGSPMTEPRRERVLHQIKDLNASIQNSKAIIRRLEQRLQESGTRLAGLERLVENLKRSVGEREAMIEFLTVRVDSLRVRVTHLETDVAAGEERIREHQETIKERERELSTIYYVVGTRETLKRLGVVQETGGLIGLGKTPQLTGKLDPTLFTPFDTDAVSTLRVAGRKPAVLTAQNRSSYQIVSLSPEWSELRISDPREFRKVRYLVVQVD